MEGKLYFFDAASPLKPVEIAKEAIHPVVPHPLEAGVFAAVLEGGHRHQGWHAADYEAQGTGMRVRV